MKKYLIYGACALMTLGLASCHADDPLYDNVVPAPVQKLPTGLSGVVTDAQGVPQAGIVVTLAEGVKTTTDKNGHYSFDNVAAGNYVINVDGGNKYQSVARNLTVVDVQNNATQEYVENFTLYNKKQSAVLNVNAASGDQSADVTSESVPNNQEGQVEISVDVPTGAVEGADDVQIWIQPIYTEESAKVKAVTTENTMLIGATLESNKAVTLKKDVNVSFDVDSSVSNVDVKVMKLTNGNWAEMPASSYTKNADGTITIPTRDFTSYGLFLNLSVNVSPASSPITLNPAGYNNVNGTDNYYFSNSTYNYTSGTQINLNAGNKLQGLMIEYIARTFGMKTVDLTGTYPVEKSIPVGTFYNLSGYQERQNITVSKNNTSVSAVSYGTVYITATSGTGAHNGGGR